MSLWTQAIAGPLAAAVAAMPPGRRLVALAGPPGAGKSTLAAEAAAVLPGATVLPMDGYHLDDAILAERGILHRKGSPESFDAAGFLSLVRRLRDEAEVFHPVFDRTREQSIAGAGRVGPEHRLVLVEGNYLLLDRPIWRELGPLFDLTVMVAAPLDELSRRLRERWQQLGKDQAAVARHLDNDLANARAVFSAVRRLTDPSPAGLGMSARGITVSTVGLVPRIIQLADEGIPVTLALSLHAPDDELRNELVPINTRFSVAETVEAAWDYARVTKRRVSIEYAMMRGINDQAWRADLLADVLNAHGDWGWVHVNLIPLNPTPGSKWTASEPRDEREFVRRLEAKGIPTTVRDTRGREIDGACGQLAAKE